MGKASPKLICQWIKAMAMDNFRSDYHRMIKLKGE
jgi:hypothetical protein